MRRRTRGGSVRRRRLRFVARRHPPALVEVLPEVPPEELVASMKDIVNQCGGLDELPEQVLTQFQDEFGMSPEGRVVRQRQTRRRPFGRQLRAHRCLRRGQSTEPRASRDHHRRDDALRQTRHRSDITSEGRPRRRHRLRPRERGRNDPAIEADPASHAEFTDEAANTAGAARCRAVLPPASASGTVSASAGAPLLRAAVADELIAVYGGDLDPTAASCIAGELVAALGLAASSTVTAADVAAYFEGAYSAEDLGTVPQRRQREPWPTRWSTAPARPSCGAPPCPTATSSTRSDGPRKDPLARRRNCVRARSKLSALRSSSTTSPSSSSTARPAGRVPPAES